MAIDHRQALITWPGLKSKINLSCVSHVLTRMQESDERTEAKLRSLYSKDRFNFFNYEKRPTQNFSLTFIRSEEMEE